MAKFNSIDKERLEIVKDQLRNKSTAWIFFILFGWSYGSLGKISLQLLWYTIIVLTGVGIYQNLVSQDFTLYTAFALIGLPVWLIWSVVRMFTLNKAIDAYNRNVADFFGLNREEKTILGIE